LKNNIKVEDIINKFNFKFSKKDFSFLEIDDITLVGTEA